MKILKISFLFFLLHLSIFGQLLFREVSLSAPVLLDSNFVPLHVGNTWQYMRTSYGPFGYTYALKYSTVLGDTAIGEHTYYKITDFFDYIRYSKCDNKLYIRWNDSDYVHIDFNMPDGTFYQIFSQWHSYISVYAEAGEHNLLYQNRNYGGYLYIGPNNDGYQIIFTDSIGMSYDRSAGFHFDDTRKIIEAIVYDSSGIPIYFNDYHQPDFLITPITEISSADFNLNFQITHHYTRLPSVPGLTSGVDFIDSVRMYSFYCRKDSIINNSPITPIHNLVPVNCDYLISIQIDTLLMKEGFVFNYRFWAKDKGIIPEFSSSPDSGYYQCVWDTPTNIEDEDIFVNPFSLSQNYPNPFNPSTKIKYSVPQSSIVLLKVFDVLGDEIATLVDEEKPAGTYEVEFDGNGLTSGLYFYRLQAGSFVATKKMLLMK